MSGSSATSNLHSELEEVLKQYKVFLARKSSDKSQFLLQVPSTAAAAAPDDQHSQQQKQPLLPLILSLFEDLILSDPVAYSIKFPSEDSLWRVVYATISSYRIHLENLSFPGGLVHDSQESPSSDIAFKRAVAQELAHPLKSLSAFYNMLVLQLAILFDHETSFGASSTTQSSSSSTLISSLFSSSTATSSSNNLYTFAVKIYKACTPHDSQETIPSFISSSTSSSLVRLFHLYSLMYRSIQHQADISRYHRMYCHTDSFSPSSSLSSTAILSGVTPSQLEFKSWIPVLALHLKALRLTPSFGRTYSQLGILHGRINDKLGASYWYSLGASIIVTFIKAFENLDKFYDAYSKMRAAGIFGGSNAASSAGGGGDDDVLDRMDISDDISHGRSRRTIIEPSSSKDLASRVLSIQMRFLFQRSSLDKDSCWNGYQDFIDVVADRLDSFEADDDNHEDGDENLLSVKRGRGAYQYFPKEIKQTLFVLLMTFSELDVIFLESDITVVRVKLRSMQSMILSIIFETLTMLLKTVIPELKRWIDEDARCNRQILKLLESISMCCIWLHANVGMISLYKEWEQTIGLADKQLNKTLMNFMKLFAEFINLICPFIDLDDTNTDCLPCDIELMASRLFFDYYKSLDSDCWVHVLRQPIDLERDVLGRNDVDDHDVDVFCARVATLAKLLISKEHVPEFRFDETTGQFVLADEIARRMASHKKMKQMAEERLHVQVMELEAQVKQLTARPVAIVALDCYLSRLGSVKKWLSSRKCRVILTSDVIESLDRLKNGQEVVNMRARDANRYLEQRFKYKAENLRAQQDHETIGPPHVNWNEFQLAATESTTSSSSSSSSTPLYVSSEYRAILGCYLYFLQNKKAAFGVESPVILISDDTQLQDYCRSIFGAVYCLNALSFSKSLAK